MEYSNFPSQGMFVLQAIASGIWSDTKVHANSINEAERKMQEYIQDDSHWMPGTTIDMRPRLIRITKARKVNK